MQRFGRRTFVRASTLVGGLAVAPAAFARSPRQQTYRTFKSAVVIGSGFGGSVAALRLAEAGIDTVVLERGQHWPYTGPDSYPSIANSETDERLSWLADSNAITGQRVSRYTGMLEHVVGDTTDVIVPACVGGGSLVFGGTLFQPKRELFEQVFPTIDYDAMDRWFYPRVLSRISGGPIPDDVLATPTYASSRELIDTANQAGLEVIRTGVCFDWDVVRDELSGKRDPAASVGEYLFGCNSGAKNSLDKNYLADAQKTGRVRVLSLHNVTDIVRTSSNCFEVHSDVLEVDGSVKAKHVVICKQLFLAGGTLGTTKLLLKAKATGTLQHVNDEVGRHWGNNGDYLIARLGVDAPVGTVQGGPPAVAVYDASGSKPVAFAYSPTSRQGATPMQLQMSMSVPEALGELEYNSVEDSIKPTFPFDKNAPSRDQYFASTQKLAAVSGGMVVGEEGLGRTVTAWHPLGGAVMGKACSYLGELYEQPNLYVLDGSLLPGAAGGANPSLTIAANAERIMSDLIARLR